MAGRPHVRTTPKNQYEVVTEQASRGEQTPNSIHDIWYEAPADVVNPGAVAGNKRVTMSSDTNPDEYSRTIRMNTLEQHPKSENTLRLSMLTSMADEIAHLFGADHDRSNTGPQTEYGHGLRHCTGDQR